MSNLLGILNRLAKWRFIFGSWQCGTRPDTDPEIAAIKDHREATIMLRAEVDALAAILVEKKICTSDDFNRALENEAIALMKSYEYRFPGATATDIGMSIDVEKAMPWLSKFPK